MCHSFSRLALASFMWLAALSTESATWVAQQAHQLVWKLQEEGRVMRFGLHDGDTKFSASLNAVFAACNQQSEAEVPREGRTPMRLLWVCGKHVWTTCSSCTNVTWDTSSREYSQEYNRARPHQERGYGMVRRRAMPSGTPVRLLSRSGLKTRGAWVGVFAHYGAVRH